MIIDFLSTSLLWLALWAIREVERRRAFNALRDQIEELRASDRRLREENEIIRRREQKHLQMIAYAQDRAGEICDQFSFGGSALLPAAAINPTGQRSIDHSLKTRVTTGLPRLGGPDFSRREQ
jgi:hypothetical protein